MIKISTLKELEGYIKEHSSFFGVIPDEVYRNFSALNQSLLKEYKYSPAHFLAQKNRKPVFKKEFEIGQAAHVGILEGREVFESSYCRQPKFDSRTKKGKEDKAKFIEENSGKTALDCYDYDLVNNLISAVKDNPKINKVFCNGIAEVSAITYDCDSSCYLKGKIDYWHPEKRILIDLKTTGKQASENVFKKSFIQYGYYMQLAYYVDLVERIINDKVNGVLVVAVEKSAPYGVNMFSVSSEWLDLGRQEYQHYLKLHAECEKKVSWPSYENKVVDLGEPPHWLVNKIHEENYD